MTVLFANVAGDEDVVDTVSGFGNTSDSFEQVSLSTRCAVVGECASGTLRRALI